MRRSSVPWSLSVGFTPICTLLDSLQENRVGSFKKTVGVSVSVSDADSPYVTPTYRSGCFACSENRIVDHAKDTGGPYPGSGGPDDRLRRLHRHGRLERLRRLRRMLLSWNPFDSS